ncbi:MarR family transcriptional regulator [Egibacter rhizosphaerae]|uniref:MarR family transcriptional regulator n=2 Tax=Egibacter rhizosphaerae TaxID=1670831 RepID=A0A411YL96_9ACTN|nr:MarR family transcriptional regulator [Egibacter rhizosphaerae]
MGDELEGEGLTQARAELLWRLHVAGPSTQRALSEALRCTPRNVTGLVDALEAAGLVRREPHPEDRRAMLVTLTPQGEKLLARWREGYEQLAGRLFGDVSAGDLRGFHATLSHMLEQLRRQ